MIQWAYVFVLLLALGSVVAAKEVADIMGGLDYPTVFTKVEVYTAQSNNNGQENCEGKQAPPTVPDLTVTLVGAVYIPDFGIRICGGDHHNSGVELQIRVTGVCYRYDPRVNT